MTPIKHLEFEFVESFPNVLEEGRLYISMTFASAAHKCCCGCGQKVITPISVKRWTLTFDGESVSLSPSIGNWNFPCRSHYWIRRNRIHWAEQWSQDRVEAAREFDHHSTPSHEADIQDTTSRFDSDEDRGMPKNPGIWQRIKEWFKSK